RRRRPLGAGGRAEFSRYARGCTVACPGPRWLASKGRQRSFDVRVGKDSGGGATARASAGTAEGANNAKSSTAGRVATGNGQRVCRRVAQPRFGPGKQFHIYKLVAGRCRSRGAFTTR